MSIRFSTPLSLLLKLGTFLSVSEPQSAPSQSYPTQSQKPYWTASKILALVLVIVLAVGVSGFAAFNYARQNSSSLASNICSNGATNYPSCNNNTCSNGATNPTACNNNPLIASFQYSPSKPGFGETVSFYGSGSGATPPYSYTWDFGDGGSATGSSVGHIFTQTICIPISNCMGAPSLACPVGNSCTFQVTLTVRDNSQTRQQTSSQQSIYLPNPECSNGATNYPQCTVFKTTTTITCTPATLTGRSLNSTSCYVTVSSSQSPTVPTGSVGFTASVFAPYYWAGNNIPCTLTLATGYSYCNITGVSTSEPSGTMTIYAGYGGDSTHAKSDSSFNISVVAPPTTVTVSGIVSVSSGNTPYQIQFVDATGVGHTAAINNGGSNSGSYSINLPNLTSYQVTVYYNSLFGVRTCSGGTLSLQSATIAVTENYSC